MVETSPPPEPKPDSALKKPTLKKKAPKGRVSKKIVGLQEFNRIEDDSSDSDNEINLSAGCEYLD